MSPRGAYERQPRGPLGGLLRPAPWMKRAACRGIERGDELFFPERGASTREAKAVCRSCPVRMECLDYAIENGEKHGIWGGMVERERRRIRRQRRRGAA